MAKSQTGLVTMVLLTALLGGGLSATGQSAPPLPLTPPPTGTETLPAPLKASAPKTAGPIYPEERPISSLTASIAPKSPELPQDVASAHFAQPMRAEEIRPWRDTVYFWDAPDYCHRPLYYQEINLERYGYTPCPVLQPAISGAHFFAATVALPYSMTVHPSRECVYPLGHYRPGSYVPRQIHWPELRPKALTVEAGVTAGLILLIP